MKKIFSLIIFIVSVFYLSCNISLCAENTKDRISTNKEPYYYDTKWQYYSDITGYKELGLWGFYDGYGVVVTPRFSEIGAIGSDLIKAKYMSFYGVINKNGNVVVPFVYDDIEELSNDYFAVKRYNLYGIVSKEGTVICSPNYDEISNLGLYYFKIKNYNSYGVMTKTGTIVFKPQYKSLLLLGVAYFLVQEENKKYVVDILGNYLFESDYSSVENMGSGYFRVKNYNKRSGMVDRTGNVVVPLVFDKVNTADNGYYKVKQNGKWGAYSAAGKKVFDCLYGPLEINKKIKSLSFDNNHFDRTETSKLFDNLKTAQAYYVLELYTLSKNSLNMVLNSLYADEETKKQALVLKNNLSQKGYTTVNTIWTATNNNTSENTKPAASKTTSVITKQNTTTVTAPESNTSNNSVNSDMLLKLKQAKLFYDNARYNTALNTLNQIISNPACDKKILKEAYNLRYMIKMYYTNDEAGAEADYKVLQTL